MSESEKAYYDISPVLSPRTAVFPGDTPFSRSVMMSFESGHHLALSSIQTTVHVGAHADSPGHYHADGAGIDERNPMLYVGAAQVIELSLPPGARIEPAHLSGLRITAPRVLFKTGSFPDPESWNGDFNSLSPGLVRHLHAQGVKLVGIDTPSVDPAEDAVLEAHQAIYECDLAILEGLVLDSVPAGQYTLIAPPIRMEGADASPVRALLLSSPGVLNAFRESEAAK